MSDYDREPLNQSQAVLPSLKIDSLRLQRVTDEGSSQGLLQKFDDLVESVARRPRPF
jgi:hypothetical protein